MEKLSGFLLLFFFLNLATGQSDFRSFISSPDKFTSRSSSSDVDPKFLRSSNRRNLFFPPPDRLSPTRRPILSPLQGIVSSSSSPVPTLSRFHPHSQNQFSPKIETVTSTNEKTDGEYEDIYYEYYEEYILDNSTTVQDQLLTTESTIFKNRFEVTTKTPAADAPLSSLLETKTKISAPTTFSKFHSSPFRFSSGKDISSRNDISSKTVLDRSQTTKSPFRFSNTVDKKDRDVRPISFSSDKRDRNSRPSFSTSDKRDRNSRPSFSTSDQRDRNVRPSFSTSDKRDRNVRPTFSTSDKRDRNVRPTNSSTANRKGSLAELLSKLAGKNNPASNAVDSDRESRILEKPNVTTVKSTTIKRPNIISKRPFDIRYRITNSTDRTIKVGSVKASHSVQILEETTTESPERTDTTEESLIETTFNTPTSKITDKLKYETSRTKGKRLLEDSIDDNLTNVITIPEGPPLNHLPSLLGNIKIAVDPDFLPPGYSVGNEYVESVNDHRPSTTRSHEAKESKLTESRGKGALSHKLSSHKFLATPFSSQDTSRNLIENIDVSKADVGSFLPSGFKKGKDDGLSVSTVDVSKFLPAGFKPSKTPEVVTVDPLSFLPPGFKENSKSDISLPIVKNVDLSKFLPPAYKSTTESPTRRVPSGLVVPRRPKRPEEQTAATTRQPIPSRPPPIKPKIQNLFDRIKALGSTGYTVPVVTQKTTKAMKTEATTTTLSTTEKTTTTTISTTTIPPRPTTPGICGEKCRLAASVRLVSGAEWKPELANRDTFEFQILANQIENELDAFYRRSSLSPWYDYVEVDSFNRGSVIVSYILSLTHIEANLDTIDLKQKINEELEDSYRRIGNFSVDPSGTDFIVIPEPQVVVEETEENFLIPEWLIAVIVIGLASFLFILIFGAVALVSRARGRRKRANVPLTEEFLNNLNALQVTGIDNYAMNGLYDMEPPSWNEKYPEKYSDKYSEKYPEKYPDKYPDKCSEKYPDKYSEKYPDKYLDKYTEKYQEKPLKAPSSRGKGYNAEYNVNIYDSWRTDYSAPYASSSDNRSKRRSNLDFDGKQFYKDDPYDDF